VLTHARDTSERFQIITIRVIDMDKYQLGVASFTAGRWEAVVAQMPRRGRTPRRMRRAAIMTRKAPRIFPRR